MKESNSKVDKIIFKVMDSINQSLLSEGSKLALNDQTKLFGEDSLLDSLDLVNLIVGIENELEEEFGVQINLVTEESLSLPINPFTSVATLSKYITSKLE
jgi:acyl carrier protein